MLVLGALLVLAVLGLAGCDGGDTAPSSPTGPSVSVGPIFCKSPVNTTVTVPRAQALRLAQDKANQTNVAVSVTCDDAVEVVEPTPQPAAQP